MVPSLVRDPRQRRKGLGIPGILHARADKPCGYRKGESSSRTSGTSFLTYPYCRHVEPALVLPRHREMEPAFSRAQRDVPPHLARLQAARRSGLGSPDGELPTRYSGEAARQVRRVIAPSPSLRPVRTSVPPTHVWSSSFRISLSSVVPSRVPGRRHARLTPIDPFLSPLLTLSSRAGCRLSPGSLLI